MANNNTKNFNEKIYDLVRKIPLGKVATYGQLAFMAGSPRASRIVGAVMAKVPPFLELPCHRVIYSDGSLCRGMEFGSEDAQRELLKSEGVIFLESGKVDLKMSIWKG